MKAKPHAKFCTPYRISGMCKECTPEKKSNDHTYCYNVNCICWHHVGWSALWAREHGLRTIPKPGDPDYQQKESS